MVLTFSFVSFCLLHLEYSEFVVAAVLTRDLLDEKRLRAVFAEFDLDGSGSISVDELKEIFGRFTSDGVVDEEMLDAIIYQVDKNGDGEIDFEEFRDFMCITASKPSKETVRAWTTRNKSKSMKHLTAGKARSSLRSVKGLRRSKSLKVTKGGEMTFGLPGLSALAPNPSSRSDDGTVVSLGSTNNNAVDDDGSSAIPGRSRA